jgi:hypothetical protein
MFKVGDLITLQSILLTFLHCTLIGVDITSIFAMTPIGISSFDTRGLPNIIFL